MAVPAVPNQQRIIELARQKIAAKPVYLDTETTGLDKNAEIVEIAVIDEGGGLAYQSLVRPSRPIPGEVSRLHGITNDMVVNAPSWPTVWAGLRPILINRPIGIYNAEFDIRMMRQSMERYRLPWRDNLASFDIMHYFSEYRAEWDPIHRSLRRFKLEQAGQFLNIAMPNSHRSTDDARLARAVLHAIAGLDYQ